MSGEKLQVGLGKPRGGWMSLTLRVDGESIAITVSHTPFDSLGALVDALCAFLEHRREGVAHFNGEPERYALRFQGAEDLRVTLARDEEVLFEHEGPARVVARKFWRALRKLEAAWDPTQWNFAFPSKGVEMLGRLSAE